MQRNNFRHYAKIELFYDSFLSWLFNSDKSSTSLSATPDFRYVCSVALYLSLIAVNGPLPNRPIHRTILPARIEERCACFSAFGPSDLCPCFNP